MRTARSPISFNNAVWTGETAFVVGAFDSDGIDAVDVGMGSDTRALLLTSMEASLTFFGPGPIICKRLSCDVAFRFAEIVCNSAIRVLTSARAPLPFFLNALEIHGALCVCFSLARITGRIRSNKFLVQITDSGRHLNITDTAIKLDIIARLDMQHLPLRFLDSGKDSSVRRKTV